MAALFSQALADPGAFGLTNVINPAAPGLLSGASSYDTTDIEPNAHEYMFWDDLHPTTAVHAILAQRALELFLLPGDFNRDNVVDAADYVVWRKELNTPDDYNLWRTHFGQSSGGGSSWDLLISVPEPAAVSLMLAVAVFVTIRRRHDKP